MRTLALALLLAGCGAVLPEAHVLGRRVEVFGFACPCGSQVFHRIGGNFEVMRVRCPDCHGEWRLTRPPLPRRAEDPHDPPALPEGLAGGRAR